MSPSSSSDFTEATAAGLRARQSPCNGIGRLGEPQHVAVAAFRIWPVVVLYTHCSFWLPRGPGAAGLQPTTCGRKSVRPAVGQVCCQKAAVANELLELPVARCVLTACVIKCRKRFEHVLAATAVDDMTKRQWY